MSETNAAGLTDPAAVPQLSQENCRTLAQALRDFFSARNADDIQRAALALAACLPGEAQLAQDEAGRLEEEYAFNQLFVGPGAVLAPPYASVYLDTEPELMGQSTLQMRDLLGELGLRVPREGQDPEDHLACELGVWLVLTNLLQRHSEPPELHAGLRAALDWLMDEHMARWIPLFTQRAHKAKHLPPAVTLALSGLTIWLHNGTQRNTKEYA